MKSLGLRYERLLMLAAPLSLLALFALLISMATENQKEYLEANCYALAVSSLEANQALLSESWQRETRRQTLRQKKVYEHEHFVDRVVNDGMRAAGKCHSFTSSRTYDEVYFEPSELIAKWKKRSELPKSVQYAGIEIPELASIGVLGTTVKIQIIAVTQGIQVALYPALLLWLGSLYNTRYRETLFNGAAHSITEIFPHIVNVYPVGRFQTVRKRSWASYHFPKVIAAMYGLFRISLLAVFIAPPLTFYGLSLYYFHPPEHVLLLIGFCALLTFFVAAIIAVELFPWHFKKTFPGPVVFKI